MDISRASICIPTIICMYLYSRATVMWVVALNLMLSGQILMRFHVGLRTPPAFETTAVANWWEFLFLFFFLQHNLSNTHLTLRCFLSRSFLVPLWLMCLALHMLPLRQEQLTASLTLPKVPEMTQANRIRARIWGCWVFLCMCAGHGRNIHEVVCFLANLCQERRKVQQLGWADGLAVALLWKTRLEGVR